MKLIKLTPTVFTSLNQVGDFNWMLRDVQWKNTLFIFNDNVSQSDLFLSQASNNNIDTLSSACTPGKGNGIIRPFQCVTPPRAIGIPTGPGFKNLDSNTKTLIDKSIIYLGKMLLTGNYDEVIYSAQDLKNPMVLGHGTFIVPNDVLQYIPAEIKKQVDTFNMTSLATEFSKLGIDNLTTEELNVLVAAYGNLSGPKENRGNASPFLPYGALEASPPKPKFALDRNAFQIMRRMDPTTADLNTSWQRFGLQIEYEIKEEKIRPFVSINMFEFASKAVDIARDLPEVALHLNRLWKTGTRVIALLGSARLDIKAGMLLIEPVQQIIDSINDAAYMTGGYRGEQGNSYGITRAGFDVPKSRSKQTIVVMCEAGLGNAHQTADSRSIYGLQWGDDTPGLSAASDVAIFFRNVPANKNFGAWTEVEIANFLHLGKGLAIFDPTLTSIVNPDGSAEEIFFGKKIKVFKDPLKLAAYIESILPTSEEVIKRIPLNPNLTDIGKAIYQRQIDGDMLIEDWLAVRLNFINIIKPIKVIEDRMMARWVRNDRRPFYDFNKKNDPLKINYPYYFSDKPEAMEAGKRDLILSGYWKDIMLLQILGKLKEDETNELLIESYAQYRMQINKILETDISKNNWFQKSKIDDVWFIYLAEHVPGVIDWLTDLTLDDYAVAVGVVK